MLEKNILESNHNNTCIAGHTVKLMMNQFGDMILLLVESLDYS